MPRISAGLNDALNRLPVDKGLRKAVDNQRDAICATDMNERDLLSPELAGPVSIVERRAIAVYVAALHHERELADRYLTLLAESDKATEPVPSDRNLSSANHWPFSRCWMSFAPARCFPAIRSNVRGSRN